MVALVLQCRQQIYLFPRLIWFGSEAWSINGGVRVGRANGGAQKARAAGHTQAEDIHQRREVAEEPP